MQRLIKLFLIMFGLSGAVQAQDLTVVTVTRPPFSMPDQGAETGFSLDLWRAVAKDLKRDYVVNRVENFSDMLGMVQGGDADIAVANISITASREAIIDFSQPIFESGLQIMVPSKGASNTSIFSILFSPGLFAMLGLSMAVLFGAGMLMWRLENKTNSYFDTSAKEAAFPAFWWALNLVVNGGFEERKPTTFAGRIFGVFLVISSLFVVSIFVAKVTATLTVGAIQSNIVSINSLYGKQVGTINGSTASLFMDARDLRYLGYPNLQSMLTDFESGNLDAVVFDAPILAFYASDPAKKAKMAGPLFRRENYGFALPSGSDFIEPINQSLLRIREDGTYEKLFRKWFGSTESL
ncbi:MAG: transporter substrate-binding domain-containing protein [Paracoccaceae bacterium]